MLKSISLKFSENEQLKLPAPGITIFVGPNNAGKSLVLREVARRFQDYPKPTDFKILEECEFDWLSADDLRSYIQTHDRFRKPSTLTHSVVFGRVRPDGSFDTSEIERESLEIRAVEKSQPDWWAHHVVRWGLIRLDGRSRFNLVRDQAGSDLLAPPENMLAHLFQDDKAREKVRALLKEAFDSFFVVDPTNLGQLRIRLSDNPPLADEQSLNAAAREFHSKATHIQDASDGIQAYTGIIIAALSGDFHTTLIDEPEAFLHPPLARKLGKNLGAIVSERGGTLMASTHSPDFLMGCVQANKQVRVVRMEYSKGKSRGKVVDPVQLEAMFKRPLMRSANIISGLFHDGLIVTESDNDRAFYAEVYARLAEQNPNFPSILFVNAQNKQTIREMIGPMRQFGVPAAAIPDIDIIKDGGKTWINWMEAAQIPNALHAGYGQQRAAINSAFDSSKKDMKSDGGITALNTGDRSAANQFFDNLNTYGIFPVRGGEMEAWLSHLGIPGKKTAWTVAMLERLGSDPTHSDYVKPANGDVWDFMRKIVAWIVNPGREGVA